MRYDLLSSGSYLSYTNSECEIYYVPRFGDYLGPCFLARGTNTSDLSAWEPCRPAPISDNNTLIAPNIPLYDKPEIWVEEGGYSAGDWFELRLGNTRLAPAEQNVTWSFDGTAVTDKRVRLTAGEHTVTAVLVKSDGRTLRLVRKIRAD